MLTMPSDLSEPSINANARVVLAKRYYIKDEKGEPVETGKELFWRVASFIAEVEKQHGTDLAEIEALARNFYDLMSHEVFLPNSPTLINAGRILGQLSACFVLPVEDSVDGIFDAVKFAAMIHKSGGGTGFSFSRLRPKNSRVGSTGGVASGPVSFMRIFNTATEQINQGGIRRGANMGILRVDHPDILDFICAKEKEGEFSNFNLSVGVTESFMCAAEWGQDYNLVDPHTKEVTGTLNAREVFDLLVNKAWLNGEPGIIFLDRINSDNPTPAQGEIESTNPCVTGDTLILTKEGYRQIEDCAGETVTVWNGFEWSDVEVRETGRNKEILDIEFSNGVSLSCTPEHKFILCDGSRVCAEDLLVGGSLLARCDFPVMGGTRSLDDRLAYTQGFFSGDGFVRKEVMNYIYLYGKKKELVEKLDAEVVNEYSCGEGDTRIAMRASNNLKPKGFVPGPEYTIATRLSWLAGLIDSDGTRNDSGGSVCVSSVDKPFLSRVQRMLHTLGVFSSVTAMKKGGKKKWPDGRTYRSKEAFRLVIGASNVAKLNELGLVTHRVDTQCSPNRDASRFVFPTKITIRAKRAKRVFCFTEPKNHSGIFNGIMTAQCGEQPLLPYEACNLGSINLSKFYNKEKIGAIDYEKLDSVVETAVRFLDNVIDASRFPLERIAKQVRMNRKIGLGVMGWADLLFQLGIPYDSDQALELAKIIMERIHKTATQASMRLAEKRGPFPSFEESVYAGKGARRNATLTTIAPTGTLSIIAGCSSGIEPLFALSFEKHIMDGERLLEVNPYFRRAVSELGVDADTVVKEVAANGGSIRNLDLPDELKRVFVTAMDIAPIWHLRMQAAFQRFTDNAVSKTVNLPNSATRDDIKDIYLLAFREGCKGVTVYRDGSRTSQVLYAGDTSSSKAAVAKEENAPRQTEKRKRPDFVTGFTQKVKTGLGSMYLTVNEVDGKPFELFATIGKSGHSVTAKAEAIGRLVSLAFRSGIDVRDVVSQLKGIGGEHPILQKKGMLLSIPDAIAWVLEKRYLKNAAPIAAKTDVLDRRLCPECGTELIFQEGCRACPNCSYTCCG